MIFNKEKIVQSVFNKVPNYYNRMNDAMSFGLHRLWKHTFIQHCEIISTNQVLDLACGTGDIALKIAKILQNSSQQLHLADPSADMLIQAQNRLIDHNHHAHYIQAQAEHLPLNDNLFDRVTIAFGFRNFHNQTQALSEIYRVLKPCGKLIILEFSHPQHRSIKQLYELYREHIIPKMGAVLADDEKSYQYLADSITNHPNQTKMLEMINHAGFTQANYTNLFDGIAAIHHGYK